MAIFVTGGAGFVGSKRARLAGAGRRAGRQSRLISLRRQPFLQGLVRQTVQ